MFFSGPCLSPPPPTSNTRSCFYLKKENLCHGENRQKLNSVEISKTYLNDLHHFVEMMNYTKNEFCKYKDTHKSRINNDINKMDVFDKSQLKNGYHYLYSRLPVVLLRLISQIAGRMISQVIVAEMNKCSLSEPNCVKCLLSFILIVYKLFNFLL